MNIFHKNKKIVFNRIHNLLEQINKNNNKTNNKNKSLKLITQYKTLKLLIKIIFNLIKKY